jgi:hypothetical protein
MKEIWKTDPLFDRPRPSHFGHHWNISGYNPSPAAILKLQELGAYINYIELARDVNFGNYNHVTDAISFNNRFLIQPNHRSRISVEYINPVTKEKQSYSGQRRHKNNNTWYAKHHIDYETGEVDNQWWLHMEKRLSGKRNIERLGILQPEDLLTFNHEQIWEKWLIYRDVDFEALFKRHEFERTGKQRRKTLATDRGNGYKLFVALSVDREWERKWFTYENEQEDPFYSKKYRLVSVQNAVDRYGLNDRIFPRIDVKWEKVSGTNKNEQVNPQPQWMTCVKMTKHHGRIIKRGSLNANL